jgi:hypothetical protein
VSMCCGVVMEGMRRCNRRVAGGFFGVCDSFNSQYLTSLTHFIQLDNLLYPHIKTQNNKTST